MRRPDRRALDSRAQDARELDITEVARRSGLPASTLRYYEEKGLIRATGRKGLKRSFAPGVVERLALITLGSAAGFSLDEIARMFAPDGAPRVDRGLLLAKAEELDDTIRELRTMRDGLRHAAACRAPSHMECPTFRRILQATSAKAGRARTRARKTAVPSRGATTAPGIARRKGALRADALDDDEPSTRGGR